MSNKKYSRVVERNITDLTTGEVVKVETEKVFTRQIDCDKFYKVFYDNIDYVSSLKSIISRNVLDYLSSNAGFNTGVLYINKDVRKDICDKYGIKLSQLSRSLADLRANGLITGDQTIIINPDIFWKGDEAARRSFKSMNMTVTFTIEPNLEKEFKYE